MANAFFSDLLSTISERGRTLLRRGGSSDDRQDADGICRQGVNNTFVEACHISVRSMRLNVIGAALNAI